jgi:hypothetical protein
MNIIFSRSAAEELSEKYLVLELESLPAGDQVLECFCVVPAERLSHKELPKLDHYRKLHESLVRNLKNKNYPFCQEIIGHLMGQFGGELDSFYQVILSRIKHS